MERGGCRRFPYFIFRFVSCVVPRRLWGEFLIGNHNHLTAPLCRLKWTALRDLLDCQIDEAVLRELMIR